MIEVFKTNVPGSAAAHEVLTILSQHFPQCRISLDLDDCDKVLRLEGNGFHPEIVIRLLNNAGLECQIME